MSNGPFLYPSVTSLPGQPGVTSPAERGNVKKPGIPGEFDQEFDKAIGKGKDNDLNQVKPVLKFSAHATQRLNDRKINLDQATMARVNDAVDKAEAKGVEDTLIITGNSALIVNVKNRTVITAMDKTQLTGNVFTNIDGAVII